MEPIVAGKIVECANGEERKDAGTNVERGVWKHSIAPTCAAEIAAESIVEMATDAVTIGEDSDALWASRPNSLR